MLNVACNFCVMAYDDQKTVLFHYIKCKGDNSQRKNLKIIFHYLEIICKEKTGKLIITIICKINSRFANGNSSKLIIIMCIYSVNVMSQWVTLVTFISQVCKIFAPLFNFLPPFTPKHNKLSPQKKKTQIWTSCCVMGFS